MLLKTRGAFGGRQALLQAPTAILLVLNGATATGCGCCWYARLIAATAGCNVCVRHDCLSFTHLHASRCCIVLFHAMIPYHPQAASVTKVLLLPNTESEGLVVVRLGAQLPLSLVPIQVHRSAGPTSAFNGVTRTFHHIAWFFALLVAHVDNTLHARIQTIEIFNA